MKNAVKILKAEKCSTCGSTNLIFETDLNEVGFKLKNDEIKTTNAEWLITNNIFNGEYVLCTCNDCGESWVLGNLN